MHSCATGIYHPPRYGRTVANRAYHCAPTFPLRIVDGDGVGVGWIAVSVNALECVPNRSGVFAQQANIAASINQAV